MKKTRYLLISLVIAVLLSACSSEPQNGKEIVPFSYTDQNGQPFGTDELAGKSGLPISSSQNVRPSVLR